MERAEQLGPFTYRWGESCFPLGQDTLLLSGFATVRRGARVCDLGCGAGALLLLLRGREPTLRLTGIECSGDAHAWAVRNLRENSLAGDLRCGDLREVAPLLPAGGFDLVIANPPYFPAGSGKPGGGARMETSCTLEELCAAAGRLLKNGGRFALTLPAARLTDGVVALRAAGAEPKRMQLVQHNPASPPSVVLLEGVRQGRPGLSVLPVCCLHRG